MTALIAVLSALGAAIATWFIARRNTIQPTGQPTDSQAEIRAGEQAKFASQDMAKEIARAPIADIDARVEQLRSRGRAGK